MKLKLIFFSIFLYSFCYSQSVAVLNSDTQEAIPFVTMILKYKGEITGGLYSDEKGLGNIDATFDTVEFSCLGFEDQVLDRANLERVVYLKPRSIVLDEIVISSLRLKDTMIGEYNVRRKDRATIGDVNSFMAVFFENTFGKAVPFHALLLKLSKIKYTTALRIHIYSRKDHFVKGVLAHEDMYNTFVPDEDLYERNIIVYLNPEDGKDVRVELSEYNLKLPVNGAFVGIEVVGYFDNTGQPVKTKSPGEVTWLEMHSSLNDNYCQKISVKDTNWDSFWINKNKWLRGEYKAMKKQPPNAIFQTPTMGIVVEY